MPVELKKLVKSVILVWNISLLFVLYQKHFSQTELLRQSSLTFFRSFCTTGCCSLSSNEAKTRKHSSFELHICNPGNSFTSQWTATTTVILLWKARFDYCCPWFSSFSTNSLNRRFSDQALLQECKRSESNA